MTSNVGQQIALDSALKVNSSLWEQQSYWEKSTKQFWFEMETKFTYDFGRNAFDPIAVNINLISSLRRSAIPQGLLLEMEIITAAFRKHTNEFILFDGKSSRGLSSFYLHNSYISFKMFCQDSPLVLRCALVNISKWNSFLIQLSLFQVHILL